MGPVGVTTGCLWCSDLFMYVEIIRLVKMMKEDGRIGRTNRHVCFQIASTSRGCHHDIQLLPNGEFLVRIKRWPVSPYCDTFDVLHVDEHLAPPIYCGHLSHLYL